MTRSDVDRAIAHAIEMAVMAEREACAQIAYEESQTFGDWMTPELLALQIEERIRNRDAKPTRSLRSA